MKYNSATNKQNVPEKSKDTKTELDIYLSHVSDYVLWYLGKKNLSLNVFSGLCGISSNGLTNVITRKNDVKLSTIIKISQGIGVPINVLLAGKDNAR